MLAYRCARCGATYREHCSVCGSCGAWGFIIPNYKRNADSVFVGDGEVVTAKDLVKKSSRTVQVMGINWGRLNVVYGPPGGGKTTFCLKVVDEFLGGMYISLEEGLSESIVEKLRWLEIMSEDIQFVSPLSIQELQSIVETHDPSVIVLDSLSISTMTAKDVMTWCKPNKHVFVTLQITKSGLPQGKMDVLHLSDVVVKIENMKWNIEKSRYQGLESGEVLNA